MNHRDMIHYEMLDIELYFHYVFDIGWNIMVFYKCNVLPGFVTLILKFSLKGFNLFIGFIQITLKFSLQAINPSCLLFSLIGSSLWCPQTGIQFLDLRNIMRKCLQCHEDILKAFKWTQTCSLYWSAVRLSSSAWRFASLIFFSLLRSILLRSYRFLK